MTTVSNGTGKPGVPGKRAVGFRAPSDRKRKSAPKSPDRPAQGHKASVNENSNETTVDVPANNARSAPPLKKRAKGSGFFAFLFLALFFGAGYALWTTFLQFQAYGIIEGRVISVAAPWDGNIVNWQVRDGDLVEQGDIVAIISNLDMEHQLAALGDELKMSQAKLDAEMSRLQFDVQNHSERTQKAMAEYLQASGDLVAEKARFKDLDRKLIRSRRLLKTKNVSKSEYEKLYFEHIGQKQKIEKLEAAVNVLRIRSEEASRSQRNGSPQLKPMLAKIDLTQAEMTRLRERIGKGQIRAPVSGRVTKRFCLTGEAIKEREPVVQILEDNSIEVVLYVPQGLTDEFDPGCEIDISLEPYDHAMRCTVRRLGDRFEPAPDSIARYYQSQQYLLPVYLTPHAEFNQLMAMKIHGTVKRPYEWNKSLSKSLDRLQQRWNEFYSGVKPASSTASKSASEFPAEPAVKSPALPETL